jgi:hypothetical protein
LCAGVWLGAAGAARADEYRAEEGCGGYAPEPADGTATAAAVVAGGALIGVGWASARRRPPSARFLRLALERAHRRDAAF